MAEHAEMGSGRCVLWGTHLLIVSFYYLSLELYLHTYYGLRGYDTV